jgi:hypothetical protein
MKSASFINEDLLLYIDNELSPDKTKEVELELNSNRDYHLQHQLLLKTKLDATETISYPNKEELYRRTERVVAFKLWMRVAAAIILVAVLSFFYYKQSSVDSNNELVNNDKNTTPGRNIENNTAVDKIQAAPQQDNQNVAVNNNIEKKSPASKLKDAPKQNKDVQTPIKQQLDINPDNLIGFEPQPDPIKHDRTQFETPAVKTVPSHNAIVNLDKESVNNLTVTSNPTDRTIDGTTPQEETVAKKGSVKGFLRKATRLIEKRTGFDPTNENGELLLGVVAVKLK